MWVSAAFMGTTVTAAVADAQLSVQLDAASASPENLDAGQLSQREDDPGTSVMLRAVQLHASTATATMLG